jgi:serine/threonine protein kinase/tetratricopeptide (TPR) repeat protein
VECFLAEIPSGSPESCELLRELLALELEYRVRRGEQPSSGEYLPRFPGQEPIVEFVLGESVRRRPEVAPPLPADHPRYRLMRLLGSGGMGSVYLAEHRVLGRRVALKVINPELLSDPNALERFRSEARAAACLSHPNVVTVYDAETAGDGHFLVMEYVAGTDLARLVAKCGPLPVEAACDYVAQAALGLEHAHRHGMVHRDITPRNLMLTDDGAVKVLDFGLAYFVSEAKTGDRPAMQNVLLGSIDYMAPEQAADPHSADIRADVYSLGCTLYFLLAGQPPFPQGDLAEKIRSHAQRSPSALVEARGDLPPELPQVLERMLAKSPAERYQSPGEVVAALAPWSGRSVATTPVVGVKASSRRGPRRAWFLATAGLLLCGLALWSSRIEWMHSGDAMSDAEAATPEAQRLYREGVLLLGQRQQPQIRQAIRRLQSAIELAPDFALAYATLADAYNLCGDYGWMKADEAYPKAKEAAQAAVARNPRLAEAHLALAFVLDCYDGDNLQADKEYLEALRLNPKLPAAHHWYAWFLVHQGRTDEAVREIDEAQKLGPDQVIIADNAGKIAYLLRDYPLAVAKHKYALELNPDFRKAHRDLALVYAETGNLDESLREIELAKGLTDDGLDLVSVRAYAYARNGRADAARELLGQLEAAAAEKPLAQDIAAVYAVLGENRCALEWLDRAFQGRVGGRASLAVDPRFDALQTDPRFKRFIRTGT